MKISFLSTLASITLFLTCMTGSMHAAYGAAKAKFEAAQRKLNSLLAQPAEDIEENDIAFKKQLEALISTLRIEGQKAGIPATTVKQKVAESQKKLTQKMQNIKTFAETFPPEVTADIDWIKRYEDSFIQGIAKAFEENYAALQDLSEGSNRYPKISTTSDYKVTNLQINTIGKKLHNVNTTFEENRTLWPLQKISTVESFFENYGGFFENYGGKYYTLVIDKLIKQLYEYALDDESDLIGDVTDITWKIDGKEMDITGTVLSDASTEGTLNLLGVLSSCYPENRINVVTDLAQLSQEGYSPHNGQTFVLSTKADLLIQAIGYARELLYFLIGVNEGYAYACEMGQYFPGTATMEEDVADIEAKTDTMKKNIVYYINYANRIVQEAEGLIQSIKKSNADATGVSLVYPGKTKADEFSFADYKTGVTGAIIEPMNELCDAIFAYQEEVKDQDGALINFFEFDDDPVVEELDSIDDFYKMIESWKRIVNNWAPEEEEGGEENPGEPEENPGEPEENPEEPEENPEEEGANGGSELRSSQGSTSSEGSLGSHLSE